MSNREDLIKRVSERLDIILRSQDSNILKNSFFSKNSSLESISQISSSNLRKTASEIIQKDISKNNLENLVRDILFPNSQINQNENIVKKVTIVQQHKETYQSINNLNPKSQIPKRIEKIYIPPLDLKKTEISKQNSTKNIKKEILTKNFEQKENLLENKKMEHFVEDKKMDNLVEDKKIDISDILETYDIKNERLIHNADVYFAIIEIAQKYPDFYKVPAYGNVSNFLEKNYKGKDDISYEEFKDIIKHFK